MTENNGYTVLAVTDPKPSDEEVLDLDRVSEAPAPSYELIISDLRGQLDAVTRSREFAKQQYDELYDAYTKVQRYIQASIDREEWTDTELQEPFWEELADMLGLTLKQERTVTVTATWVLTVKTNKPFLSDWDFDFSIESDTGEVDIINGDGRPDIDISE